MYPDSGFDFMFNAFPIIFFTIFIIVIGGFIFAIVSNISRWNKNNNSPILTVDAKIVTKRMNVSHHDHYDHHDHNNAASSVHRSSSTTYYVTFQVESGDRMELHVDGYDYGMLVEGDYGKLTFQGTRFKSFIRN